MLAFKLTSLVIGNRQQGFGLLTGLDRLLFFLDRFFKTFFEHQHGSGSVIAEFREPQELIVPVMVMHSTARLAAPTTGIQWTLTPGTSKLTTRFFSVQIAGGQSQSSLFAFEPPKVRIELRANKRCVSMPVSASYGFEDASLRRSHADFGGRRRGKHGHGENT